MVRKLLLVFLILTFFISLLTTFRSVRAGNIHRVPEDYSTIQAAINAAVTGDVVLIGPGTYNENLVISGKTITLASHFYNSGDRQFIDDTIINGQQLGPVIEVNSNVGPETTIQGLTIYNGLDGIKAFAKLNILDNHFDANDDGIDFSNSGGLVRGNIFENGSDDGVDFDDKSEAIVENNIMRNNFEDGIEIRMQEYTGPTLAFTIRNNQLIGNGQDGIQIISYSVPTNRVINIEHNLIKNNERVGIGLMDNQNSGEDYRAASLPERINVFNNTFSGNKYSITGGDNLAAVNNIFTGSSTLGIKNIDGNSVVAHNLFWNNAVNHSGSNVDLTTTLFVNPLLLPDTSLQYASPAIDSAIAQFSFAGTPVFEYLPGTYFGTAPDLGWLESNYLTPPTDTPTPPPQPGDTLTFTPLDDATINGADPTVNYGSDFELHLDNSPAENFLIKFQVSGWSGLEIAKATLKLYNTNPSTKGGNFYQVLDNSWTEETVTWNNAPAAEMLLLESLGAVTLNSWISVDLTPLITSEGLYSLLVRDAAAEATKYSSKEGFHPPVLEIVLAGETTATPPPGGTVRFAVIGDYGDHSQGEADVAALVDSWNPDFVTTVGDNNYPIGAAGVIDQNIGQYYHEYIYPYTGSYGEGASTNRFYPSIGNHDMDTALGQPYLDYFNLPGNERYYDFVQGPVHFFVVNSDPREPDGTSSTSVQGQWLQSVMTTSTAPWQIVIFHHAPYSSGSHGSSTFMRWPFAGWGADAVLTGHDHTYERLNVGSMPYFVNGIGGSSIYNFINVLPESQVRFNDNYGAMLVEASDTDLNFKFYSISNTLIDSFDLNQPPTVTDTPSPSATTAVPTDTETVTPSPSDTVEPSVTVTNPVPLDQFIYFLPIILVP